MFCSHFHQVLDLGIARGDFALGARSYYGRDVHATTVPPLSTYEEVAEAAAAIVAGEADRATAEGAGYRAMALPSAAQVAAQLAAFTTVRTAAGQAEFNTNREQEEAGALYPEAQALAVEIYEEVDFFHRKDQSLSSRRAKNRRWGIVYIYEPNEPIDPGDTTGQTTDGAAGDAAPRVRRTYAPARWMIDEKKFAFNCEPSSNSR